MNSRSFGFAQRGALAIATLAMVAGAGIQAPSAASAAGDPGVACHLTKAAAASKYSSCLAGLYGKSIGKSTDASKVGAFKCYSKFVLAILKAEEKAAGACPTSDDAYDLEGIVDTCMDDVLASLGGVPGPGGDEAKCQSGKMKTAGKYASCLFKTLSKAIKDGVSPDLAGCDDKLTSSWTKLDAGTCSTSGDYASVKGDIDACYDDYESAIDGVVDAVIEYQQDFEAMNPADGAALSSDAWKIFANVFDSGSNYLYGYGVFDAPNGTGAFCAVDTGQGGAEQGSNQLSIYSDYNNTDHGVGNLIEANVFRERAFVVGDVGNTITFAFDAKAGNINDPSGSTTAIAFIKTLDPNNGYATTNFITLDTTNLPATWGNFSVSIDVDGSLVGQLFQFGFSTTASNYEPSGNFYDNIVVSSLPTP